VWTGFI